MRVADISEYHVKQHISMPKVIDFGVCDEGKHVYTLLEWVEGVEVQAVLEKLTNDERYKLGKESGRILRMVHNSSS